MTKWAIISSSPRGNVRLLTSAATGIVAFSASLIRARAQTSIPISTNALQLAPPKPQIPPTFWESHGMAVIIAAAAALAILLAAIISARKLRKPPIVVPGEIARKELASLAEVPEDGNVLSRTTQILRHYFMQVLRMGFGELTTREFCGLLSQREDVDSAIATRTVRLLRAADERKFRGNIETRPLGAVREAYEIIVLQDSAMAAREHGGRAAQGIESPAQLAAAEK